MVFTGWISYAEVVGYGLDHVARSYLAKVDIDPEVIGSVLLMPAKVGPDGEQFDYGDNYPGRTPFLRIGEIALFSALNDARAVLQFWTAPEQSELGYPLLTVITHALSPIQVRELMAELVYTNLRIGDRPVFKTIVDPATEQATIVANTPVGYHFGAGNREFHGQLLHHLCGRRIESIAEPERSDIGERVKAGRFSFLWAEDGTQVNWDL
jgi:hypothetical protein